MIWHCCCTVPLTTYVKFEFVLVHALLSQGPVDDMLPKRQWLFSFLKAGPSKTVSEALVPSFRVDWGHQ